MKAGLFSGLLILSILFQCCKRKDNQSILSDVENPGLKKFIGKRFDMTGFTDTLGRPAEIDLHRTPLTLIDLWFDHCPSCNIEMSQFAKLLRGKEKEISVCSISISSLEQWKKMLPEDPAAYAFLQVSIPNWRQLLFSSVQDPKLHNSLSFDRLKEIEEKWQTHSFPIYFVIDEERIIKAVPYSAVGYLKRL